MDHRMDRIRIRIRPFPKGHRRHPGNRRHPLSQSSNAWSWAESELQVERARPTDRPIWHSHIPFPRSCEQEREQEQEGAGEPAEEAIGTCSLFLCKCLIDCPM